MITYFSTLLIKLPLFVIDQAKKAPRESRHQYSKHIFIGKSIRQCCFKKRGGVFFGSSISSLMLEVDKLALGLPKIRGIGSFL